MTGTLLTVEELARSRRRQVRRWRLVALVVVLIAGLVVIVLPWGLASIGRSRYESTVDRVSRASLPEGLPDATVTDCRGVGVLCGTTSSTPGAAVRSVTEHLSANGVAVGPVQCGDGREDVAATPAQHLNCRAVDESLGRVVVVQAFDELDTTDGPEKARWLTQVQVQVSPRSVLGLRR